MQAMILAAGLGTRLRPYTLFRPKPLFPVLNRPLLLTMLDMLRRAGCSHIVVNGHHLAARIGEAVADMSDVRFQYESEVLGTGGGLRLALPEFTAEPVLVMNGDIFHTVDLAALSRYHARCGNLITMAMHDYPRFNTVRVRKDRVLTFRPDRVVPGRDLLAFTGIHVVSPEVIRQIPSRRFHHIIDLYEELVQRGEKIGIFRVDGCFWRDMGTPQDYLDLHGELLGGNIRQPRFPLPRPRGNWLVDDQAALAAGLELADWGCVGKAVVGRDVKLRRCVVWDGARIPAGSRLEDAIVTP
ncbi:MAG TPA: nucleotidyltransferase family protein [Desulfobacteraceae bacterium]|nr:nucleotidyltransferase family protein [Desulfobacteraceae bacterium]